MSEYNNNKSGKNQEIGGNTNQSNTSAQVNTRDNANKSEVSDNKVAKNSLLTILNYKNSSNQQYFGKPENYVNKIGAKITFASKLPESNSNSDQKKPPAPEWFMTLGQKPSPWGPCCGHMMKDSKFSELFN